LPPALNLDRVPPADPQNDRKNAAFPSVGVRGSANFLNFSFFAYIHLTPQPMLVKVCLILVRMEELNDCAF
jgi:hypothetical protein